MNFQGLNAIETPQFYLDTAKNRADKAASIVRQDKSGENRMQKSKTIELQRINIFRQALNEPLRKIIQSYPSLDDLPEFYQQLVKTTIDYVKLKKSLGSINWAAIKVEDFYKHYSLKIKRCDDLKTINRYRKELFGRVSSILYQIKKELAFLEEARRTMKAFPSIKTKLYTVAIAGFPNIGKTTLLTKLTPARPEINNYAFTTKGIMTGYMELNHEKIQILDTPGTLARFDKMNSVEKQAYLAIKYCAHILVYIMDLSDTYPLEKQFKLFEMLKEYDKPIICFLSKTDIIDKKVIDKFTSEHKELDCITDIEELKKRISKVKKEDDMGGYE